jgi:predicted TIM-barrel fold metal-dependent hydrolase
MIRGEGVGAEDHGGAHDILGQGLPHARCMGEDHLLIGSDYPHNDPSREDQFVNALNIREDLTPQLRQKILYKNPRRFYALAD